MHELSYPPAIDLPIEDTLASIPATRAADFPDSPMYALRAGDGWEDVTAAQFNDLVRSAARGLIARGIRPGQPVAILSPTRYEWTVLDFALWTAGAFAVPIYDSSSAEQIEWIISDSEVVAVSRAGKHCAFWDRRCVSAFQRRGTIDLQLAVLDESLAVGYRRNVRAVLTDVD